MKQAGLFLKTSELMIIAIIQPPIGLSPMKDSLC